MTMTPEAYRNTLDQEVKPAIRLTIDALMGGEANPDDAAAVLAMTLARWDELDKEVVP